MEIDKHIDVAGLRVEIMAQHRTKQRKSPNAPLHAKVGNSAMINSDGKVDDNHSQNVNPPAMEGNKLAAPKNGVDDAARITQTWWIAPFA
ncbi:MAG: hypothetical protein ACKOKC_01605 [Chthoniobacterales bacterium]